MKKKLIAGIFVIGVLLAGCVKKAAFPEVKFLQEKEKPRVVSDGRKILEYTVPERDPFKVIDGKSVAVEKGAVKADGRDPFAAAAHVAEPPAPPEEQVKPDPGEPTGEVTSGMVTVRATTLDRCWIDVYVDGNRVLRTNVPVDGTLSWEGETVTLEQVGRDYAVSVTVNGKNLGLLSEFAKKLESGPYTDRETGVQITLKRRYTGGVLVGLNFTALSRD